LIQDARTELFRHGDIAVTRSWVIVDGVRHAVRYIDQTSLATVEPPRSAALSVLFVCLLLALLTLYRIIVGDFSLGLGWLILVACAIVIVIAGYVAFKQKPQCVLTIRFENGETIPVSTDNASRASRLQDAVHDALDQLDYHDTDDARPTVVLASLGPTNLTPVSGPEPSVVNVSDKAIAAAARVAQIDDESNSDESYEGGALESDEAFSKKTRNTGFQASWMQTLAFECRVLKDWFKRRL